MRLNRPGEPDTGNPYVRFDEGRSENAEPTTSVGSIRLFPLRLLYLVHGAGQTREMDRVLILLGEHPHASPD
jgi:hypothetical protein